MAALTAAGGPDRIVVAGGDGSIGPAALCAAKVGVPLAVIAVGTANDFARAKDLPLDLDEACALARDPAATVAHAELGMAGERPFVNAAAAGLSVAAAQAAKPHKSRLGPLAYTLGALKAGVTAPTLHCAIACDGEARYTGGAWQVVVARHRRVRRRQRDRRHARPTTGGSTSRSSRPARAPGSCAAPTACAPASSPGRTTSPTSAAASSTVEIDGHPTFNVDGETCRCEPGHFTLHEGGFDVVVAS